MQHPRLASQGQMLQGQPQVYGQQQQQQPQKPLAYPVPVPAQAPPLTELHRVPETPSIRPANAPAFSRCTQTRIPRSAAVSAKTRLSLGLTVTPFPYAGGEEESVPVAPPQAPILRCSRCRTYLNPFVEVMDSGSRWKCNLCYVINDFPAHYDYDPQTQARIDRAAHPELSSPVYEFVAPAEYMVRPPQPPAYLFLLDATYPAIASGILPSLSHPSNL